MQAIVFCGCSVFRRSTTLAVVAGEYFLFNKLPTRSCMVRHDASSGIFAFSMTCGHGQHVLGLSHAHVCTDPQRPCFGACCMQSFNGHHSWDVRLHLHGTPLVLSSLELAGSNHVDVDWSYCCWSNRPDLQPARLHLGCHMCCQYSNVPFVDSTA